MCGIVGYLTRDQLIHHNDEKHLNQVLKVLAYRGPDGMGVWKSSRILLGHRRLSIIDLSSAGAQPFVDEEKGLVVTYNGEIYNFQDIRKTLIAKGYSFRSQSDTEVILAAYDYYGMEFITYLQGMFAFCLIDQKQNKAILVRDPAGEKPLYYYLDSLRFVFTSELKAFHAFPEVELSIDPEALKAYFVLQYIPGTNTIYHQIKRLKAGTMLTLDLNNWSNRVQRYWHFTKTSFEKTSTPDDIENLLAQSVRSRLVADVEVALLLSGGIDSSLLAWHMRKAGGAPRVFSASFNRSDLDELDYARQVADFLQLPQVVIDGGNLDDTVFDQVIYHADEPLGDPACIPTYLLARELSKHVKVVLSGEGADELFWGYDTYRFEKNWMWFDWLRSFTHRLPQLRSLASHWEGTVHAPPELTRLAKLFSAPYNLGASRWTSVFADHTVSRLTPAADSRPSLLLKEMQVAFDTIHQQSPWLDSSLMLDLEFWLPDDLLIKVDRMTMAHGVEARAPYLDFELIEAALALPNKEKMSPSTGKLILRRMVEKHFPGEMGRRLAWRKKHGFEVPVSDWLKLTLRDRVEDQLSVRKLNQSGFFDAKYVRNLWTSMKSSSKETPLKRKLWLILCFQSWYEWHEKQFGFSA